MCPERLSWACPCNIVGACEGVGLGSWHGMCVWGERHTCLFQIDVESEPRRGQGQVEGVKGFVPSVILILREKRSGKGVAEHFSKGGTTLHVTLNPLCPNPTRLE